MPAARHDDDDDIYVIIKVLVVTISLGGFVAYIEETTTNLYKSKVYFLRNAMIM